jgi:hypothetical protein
MLITIVAPEAATLPNGRADYHYGRTACDWKLPTVVRVAARQFLRHAQAYPPEGPVIEKPWLAGPEADPPNPEH